MRSILYAVEHSGIEYVELGYLNAQSGSRKGRTEFADADFVKKRMLMHGKVEPVSYLVMIDLGKYPVEQLEERSSGGIDGIRLCFHKKDAGTAIRQGQEILKKGYRLLMQPMVCTRYTDLEFEALIHHVQEKLPSISAFYVVDSFGVMSPEMVESRMRLADRVLKPEISLGLHAHDNLRQSFSNAEAVLETELNRPVIIDGTLAGIGKGAGNMNTELFAEYLNQNYGGHYDTALLKRAAKTIIEPMQSEFEWGYCEEYRLSAACCLTPSYAKYFHRDCHLSLDETGRLMAEIPDEKKDSFDQTFAKELVYHYQRAGGMTEDDRFA